MTWRLSWSALAEGDLRRLHWRVAARVDEAVMLFAAGAPTTAKVEPLANRSDSSSLAAPRSQRAPVGRSRSPRDLRDTGPREQVDAGAPFNKRLKADDRIVRVAFGALPLAFAA